MKRLLLITPIMCFCGIGILAQTAAPAPGSPTTAGPECRVTRAGTKFGTDWVMIVLYTPILLLARLESSN